MWSQLLAFIDLLPRLLDWVERQIKKAKHQERERRNEEIDRDPAGEFIDRFDGVHHDNRPSVPGDAANDESHQDRDGRDHTDR